MIQRGALVAFVVGLVVGAGALYLARPCWKERAGKGPAFVDGKYLIVQHESGHWVYERDDKGFHLVVKDMTPAGLKAIWDLQAAYLPQSVKVGSDTLLSAPATAYSSETGQFRVINKFYRLSNDRLIEVPTEATPAPPAPAPSSTTGPTPNR
jgi:hypothetical protein